MNIYYAKTSLQIPEGNAKWPLYANKWPASPLESNSDVLIDFYIVFMVYILPHASHGLTDLISFSSFENAFKPL